MMNNENSETDLDPRLMTLAAKLPKQVTPTRDLWPGIEAAISQPQQNATRSPWNSVWAQAAAVLLLVGGSSGVTWYAAKNGATTELLPPVQVVSIDSLFEPVSGDLGGQYSLGEEYLAARGALEKSLPTKLESLPRSTRDDVVKNLNTIRLAIREINEALAEEPDNQLLHELLLSTYHEEMNLMVKVDGLANSVMRRDDI